MGEHIKREVDEFEFDDELEFDEELQKLSEKRKKKGDDGSTPERSLSPDIDFNVSVSPPLAIPPAATQVVEDPLQSTSAATKPEDETEVADPEKSSDVSASVLGENSGAQTAEVVRPKKRTKIIKKTILRKVKVTRKKPKIGADGNPVTTPTTPETPTSDIVTPTEPT